MFIAEIFKIMSLLWGDYSYLIDEDYLTISLNELKAIYYFSWF